MRSRACRHSRQPIPCSGSLNSIPHRKSDRSSPMIRSRSILGALALAATSNFAFAQQAGQQPPARGPEMALALEAAQGALSACAANGVKPVASVVDSAGVLRLLLAADGASNNSIEIS